MPRLACLAVLALAAAGAIAVEPANLVRNPSFAQRTGPAGPPADWSAAGDSQLVTQALTADTGPDGSPCAKLACTAFRSGNPAAHAMLCQMGVPLRSGKVYRMRFRARGQAITAGMVSLAISDTAHWANCGLNVSFRPTADWKTHEFLFRATRTVGAKSRLQFWFTSTGVLRLDDVSLTEAGNDLRRPGCIIPALPGRKNLIPNASFELSSGWGSTQWPPYIHWSGPMNKLHGEYRLAEEKEVVHGRRCLEIEVSPDTCPVLYFDYFDLLRRPIKAPLAANIGYLPVEPGKPYTFSAYLKSDADGVPARMAVWSMDRVIAQRLVRTTSKWQRYSLTFCPKTKWCYISVGPDLEKGEDNPSPPAKATLWVDAVQCEAGRAASEFAPRASIELGVTPNEGPIWAWGQREAFCRTSVNNTDHWLRMDLVFSLVDYRGQCVWQGRQRDRRGQWGQQVRPGNQLVEHMQGAQPKLDLARDQWRGYFELRSTAEAQDIGRSRQVVPFALVPPRHEGQDSRFGVNHAYPWPHLLGLCDKAGLNWVRDWSLKWHDIEPTKGTFTFTEADYQIDRALKAKLRVLAMVPFPSAVWSSTAPEAEKKAAGDSYVKRRAVVARAPRDLAEFENFVQKTVAHYRGRVTWFQCFNEPLFTSYALPRKYGYDGATYATYVKAFARAARKANPKCRILGGIGYINEGQIMADFGAFFRAGGLAACDAIDIHHYPRIRAPEFIEPLLQKLNSLMDRCGGRKPIWLTEYGYYADDHPWCVPIPHHGFDQPLESEALQCAFAVRWAVLCLANGVDKIFYHAGTCDGVNRDSLQGIFFEYGGQVHKIYAAQAVMSYLLGVEAKFLRRLSLGKGTRAYLFSAGTRLVAAVWADGSAKARRVAVGDKRIQIWDLMARPQKPREFTPSDTPVYLVADGIDAAAFTKAVTVEP